MLTPEQITIALPSSPSEVYAIADDIIAVARAFRRGGEDRPESDYREFIDWLATVPHVLTMAYVDGQPGGWIRIDSADDNPDEVGRKCLEFSGAVMPEFEGRGLTDLVAPHAIDRAFAMTGKRKMIATLDEANPMAAAALERLGFEYRDTDEEGRRIYRMIRGGASDGAHS